MAGKIRIAQFINTGLFLTTLASGCVIDSETGVSAKETSQTRKLANYHSINLLIPAELTANVGSAGDLSIEADDNVISHITTTVKNGELEICSDHSLNNSKSIVINAKTAKLDQVSIKGAATTTVKGLSGASFALEAKGASTTTLSGKVEKLTAALKGASTLKAIELTAQSATVSMSGAGSAEINATNDLNATISGVGTIKYKGNPKLTKQVSGIGTIEKM